MSTAGPHPEHGTLAEEALRLVEALSGRGPEPSATAGQPHAAECTWCPLCRAVRATRPEVREHLAAAGAALVSALAAALAPPADMMSDQADDPAADPTDRPAPEPRHDDRRDRP